MRDSKVYKVLRIIFLALAIMSLVFALAKKVGLAASDSNTVLGVKSLPFPVGAGYGNQFTQAQIDTIYSICKQDQVDAYNSGSSGYPDLSYIIFNEYNSTTNTYLFYCYYDNLDSSVSGQGFYRSNFTTVDFPLDGFFTWSYRTSTNYRGARRVWINASTFTKYSADWNNSGTMNVNCSTFTVQNPDNSYSSVVNQFLYGYPVYISHDCIYNDVIYFSNNPGSGFDAPGWGDSFQEWVDDDLNPVDTSAPSNNTSTPAWLQSILNALGVVNNTVGGGFNLVKNTLNTIISFIGDLLQRILDTVVAGFEALIDALERIFTRVGTTATNVVQAAEDAADAIVDGLSDGWDLITDFWDHLHEIIEWFYIHGLDSDHEWSFMVLFHYLFDFDSTTALADFQANKYGDFVLDVRDFFNTFIGSIINQNASSRVFFTIPIGNHFGSNVGDVEINFDWYSSIRDNYLPYFMAFLYISVIWLFFKRLPDILRGVAGAESSFSDSLPYDTESKTYTNSGVYTSKTHVSNGGRSRVSFNSFKKF